MNAAGFIGAVLAPHHAEDAELGEVRVAAEDFLDARVFVGREAVLGRHLGRDFDFSRKHCHSRIVRRGSMSGHPNRPDPRRDTARPDDCRRAHRLGPARRATLRAVAGYTGTAA